MITIDLPEEVMHIISALEEAGYEAFAVGGCIRDSILLNIPKDWDICTSALPEQTKACFNKYHIIETGLQHGTVTLMLNHIPFEITTYRIDGEYTDNRRPDSVAFVRSLKEDLARRDFTINAMAYNPQKGLIDCFDGLGDLENKTIRCVGDPDKRFQEDALRIMRALRFAAVLGFSIEESTSRSIENNKLLIKNIAEERIAAELNKLILGNRAREILHQYTFIITEIIPEINEIVGFEHNNRHHYLDVWQHTLKTIAESPADLVLRLTMLFHDIGKPRCYTESDGVGHFFGHPKISAEMAKEILTRLKYDNRTTSNVTQLVLYHDNKIYPERKHVKRWLNRIGEHTLSQLLEVKKADAKGHAEPYVMPALNSLNEVQLILEDIIREQECFSIKDLAIGGRELIEIGIPEGKAIGITQKRLVDMVIDEEIENDRDALLKAAENLLV